MLHYEDIGMEFRVDFFSCRIFFYQYYFDRVDSSRWGGWVNLIMRKLVYFKGSIIIIFQNIFGKWFYFKGIILKIVTYLRGKIFKGKVHGDLSPLGRSEMDLLSFDFFDRHPKF